MFDKKPADMPQAGDSKHKAKLEVLNELRNMAMEMMGDKMKSHFPDDAHEMSKVTVAAPDQEGLEEGLEMAHDLAGQEGDSSEMHESDEDMSLDEIESMIQDLEEKRRAKLAQA